MNTKKQKLFVDELHKQYGDNEVLKGVSLRPTPAT
jgi:ABC-type histidine transport system, ATPase component